MKRIYITLICCLFICPAFAMANDISAIQAAAKKVYSVPASTQNGRDIVLWYKLRQSEAVSFHQASQFVLTHPNWPDLYTIRKKAEQSMTSNISSQEVIKWFSQHAPITVSGMTLYLNSLIKSGKTSEAMTVLKKWWVTALLTPSEQKNIIDRFGKYLGSQDHEKRLNHIILGKHYTTSRALAKLLSPGHQKLVEAKIALIEKKKNVNELIAIVPRNLQNNEALVLARIQWRRKNDHDEGAIALLNQAPSADKMSEPRAWWKERHIMARRLIEEGKWGSAYQLVNGHKQVEGFPMAQAEFVAGWIALRKIGKPWEGFKHFEKLFNNVKTPISRARGAYWAGLASDTLGHPDIANQWYQVAAHYQTTYYGQMAAQRINLPFGRLSPTPINITKKAETEFYRQSPIAAVNLLHQAGQKYEAQLFLTAYLNDGTHKKSGLDYKLIAQMSGHLGYKDMAVRIAKKAEKDGYIMPEYLFPIIQQASRKQLPIHPAFAHGIMRQESAFDQHAKSSAGALGLMQLMPATAKETAHRNGLPYSRSRLTNDPVYNMTLGSFYIQQMLNRFDGNRTLAIAAYNAGPGRVSGWIKTIGDPRDPSVDEADWIETIPIYETRNYVQRVTEAINVYAYILKEPVH